MSTPTGAALRDTRIVEMQFDNAQFEKGIKESIESLEKLKKSLDFTGVVKGMDEVSKASSRMGFRDIAEDVQYLAGRFSAMGIAGMEVMRRLTGAAMDLAVQMAYATTFRPLVSGYQEYETQINAIQTILANTTKEGTNIQIVNAALDELNEYADRTIYNFTQMTRNIGTFTAAGVKLDTSVAAIKGIANLAAVSGSTSAQASNAMYQLSQALASGTVKLMDWNSVVNAGMGGMVFQEALQETARVHGIQIDAIMKKEGSFRNSLRTGWLTSAVLLDTLAKFTGDLTEAELLNIGYTQEQTEEILKLGQTANDAATKVKTFSQLMETMFEAAQSGWSLTWRYLIGDFAEAKELYTEINDILSGAISKSAESRNALVSAFVDLGGREDLIQSLRNILEALGTAISNVKSAFNSIFPPVTAKQLKSLSEGFVKFTEKLILSDEAARKVRYILRAMFIHFALIKDVIVEVVKRLSVFIPKLKELAATVFDTAYKVGVMVTAYYQMIKANDLINKAIDSVIAYFKNFRDELIKVKNKIVDIKDRFVETGKAIVEFLKPSKETIEDTKNAVLDFSDAVKDTVEPAVGIFERLGNAMKKAFDYAKEKITQLIERVKEARKISGNWFERLEQRFPALGDFIERLGKRFNGLKEIIRNAFSAETFDEAIRRINKAIGTGLQFQLLRFVTTLNTTIAGASLHSIFDNLTESLEGLQLKLKAEAIFKIGQAILMIAGAMLILSLIDSSKLLSVTGAMSAFVAELVLMMAGFNFATSGPIKIITIGNAIKNIGKAMIFFAGAMAILSFIKPEGITQGLKVISILLAELLVFIRLTNLEKLGLNAGLGLVGLGAALLIFASAIKKLGEIDADTAGQGLVVLGILLGELGIFLRLIGKPGKVIAMAIGVGILAKALELFIGPIEQLGAIPWQNITTALKAFGLILAGVVVALWAVPKGIIRKATGFAIMAGAVTILVKALQPLAAMSVESLTQGLIGLGILLTEVVVAMNLASGGIAGAIALGIMSVALLTLAGVMKILAGIPFLDILKGLGAILGLFTIISVFSYMLTPMAPAMLAVAVAIGALGLAMGIVGGAILLFAAGITALAAAAPLLGGSIGLLASIFGQFVVVLMESIAVGLLRVSVVIIKGLKDLVTTIADTAVFVFPLLIETFFILVMTLLDAIRTWIPQILEAGIEIIFKFVTGIIRGVADNIGDLARAAADLLINFMDAVAEKLPEIVDSAFNLIISFIDGLATAIDDNYEKLFNAIEKLFTSITNAMLDLLPRVWNKGTEIVTEIISGIGEKLTDIYNKGKEIVTDFVKGVTDGFTLKKDEIVDSAEEVFSKMVDGVKDFLGIKSPSKVGKDIGKYFNEGVGKGLKDSSTDVRGAMDDFTATVFDNVRNALDGVGSEMTDNGFEIPITPVIDMSELDGLGDINGGSIPFDVIGEQVYASAASFKPLNSGSGESSVNFYQTNYSPKALSRSEIYRQTNNQLSRAKGVRLANV